MHKHHQGFGLIELAVIIAILAMLAGFAIPRFGELDRNARISAVMALSGNLRSDAGSSLATRGIAGFTESLTAGSITYSKTDAPAPANCSVTYTSSTKRGGPPSVATPVTLGC